MIDPMPEDVRAHVATLRRRLTRKQRRWLSSAADVVRWPLVECCIDSGWYEARAGDVVIARRHPLGYLVVAHVVLELEGEGVKAASFFDAVEPAALQALVERVVHEPVDCFPLFASRLIKRGLQIGVANGVRQPAGVLLALPLFAHASRLGAKAQIDRVDAEIQ